jgi:guanosine-3',5'-bis(diphosphate) 3'-pyrophosphohydrolase
MKLESLLAEVTKYDPGADVGLISRAYEFSERVHRGQKRASGEPYFSHPVEVAKIVAELHLDAASVATALLHDTVEDTFATLEEIEQQFGPEVAGLVDGVTKIGQINFSSREEKQAENFRKMLLAMARDIRVILIKLADRTHNMRTLDALSPERQLEIAQETLDIYAPIAHRLGIYWMKSELEDQALRFLQPEVYYQLKRAVAKRREERERYIAEVIAILRRKLAEAGIEAEVTGRPKHFYSIYQKMQQQNLHYDQIYDLIAFRIIVDTVRECYEALGVVHANWKPVPGRFKDYIALPKGNMYQSLHTTVIGPYGERMEVQIRTHEMHRVAEMGIAAHWRYKGGKHVGGQDAERFSWLRQLLEWLQNPSDAGEFMRLVKEDLFSDEVVVFTPKGDCLAFPEGSTVIDFAYRIHSEVGNHCAGARVNGRLVPLRYCLRNGDTVEIITTANQTPSADWLNFVKTARARQKIRTWIKQQQRERSVAIGRELLQRDCARYRVDYAKLRKRPEFDTVLQKVGVRDEESLLAAIGYGRITPRQVLSHLLPAEALEEEHPESGWRRLIKRVRRTEPASVTVGGVDDVLVRFAGCCSPVPGERIIGFLTRGRGVTVHRIDCTRVLETDPQRRVDVSWRPDAEAKQTVRVEVVCVNEPGLLAAVSGAISAVGVNISRAQVTELPDQKALNVFEVTVGHIEQLQRVLRNVGKVRGVLKVVRARA